MQENKKPYYQTWMTVVYDKQLNIIDILNPQHCMLLRLTSDFLIGMNVEDLENITEGPNKEPARIIARNVKLAAKENRNVYFEYTTTHNDNSVTYAVCYAEKGNDGLLYVNVIEIDEENIFEARDGFTNYVINTTMNNVSVGVCMRHIKDDGSKTYLLFNDVAKRMYESDDVLKSKYWNQREDDMADERAMQAHDSLKIEKVIRDDNDNIKSWWIITKKKITSRTKGYYIVTTTIDITQRRQNEILLEQQFSILDAMYEHLPVGIVIYNSSGHIVSLNKKSKEMFGITDEKDVSKLCLFDNAVMPSEIKEKLCNGETVKYDSNCVFDSLNGGCHENSADDERMFSIKATVTRNKNNEINGYLQICEDITEETGVNEALRQAKLEVDKSLSLLTKTIDKLPIGFFIKDVDTRRYIKVNDRLGEICRSKGMNAEGKTDYELHDKKIADDFKVGNDMAVAAEGEQVTTMIPYEAGGEKAILETVEAMITLSDGKRLIVGAANDVTKREASKKELSDAKERAEQSDKLKSAFLANMSHEIRTPLNAIVGFSELMTDCDNHEERAEYAHVISQNNELLLRLINDILDLSKVEAGMTDLKPERYDMSGFFNDITISLRQRITNPEIQYIVENPYCTCMVTFDKNRMAQVITNYVTNAIKYTPSGSIRVGYKQENGNIKIYVTDTGIGISEEKKNKVFKRFEKLDEFAQGSGLGLSIVKALSEVCGGNVGFESEFGKGSTFWAILPCGNIEITDTVRMEDIEGSDFILNNTKHESEIRVLVAEDNDSNYLLVRSILRNYNLTHVANGKLAVEAALNNYYDVMLMDMKMPVMNGLEATKIIHANKSDLPIIAVTANAFGSDRDAAISAGCAKFVTKPIKRQILIDAIKSVLK